MGRLASIALVLLLGASALVCSQVARAETGAAEALFRAGREAAKRGDHATACAKFAESERLEPAVGTELNLALCEEKQAHLLSAWRLFRLVIDRLPVGDPRLELARRQFAELDVRVPRLLLRAVVALPEGTQIRQGRTLLTASSLGVAIPMDTGPIELAVTAPGRLARVYRLSLTEGARHTLVIEAGEPEPVRPARSAAPKNDARTLSYLSFGLGAAFVTVGAASGLAVINAQNALEAECDESLACSPRGLAAAERGKTLSAVSTASFVLGAACIGLGGWFWFQAHTPERSPTGVSVSLGVEGVAVRARF